MINFIFSQEGKNMLTRILLCCHDYVDIEKCLSLFTIMGWIDSQLGLRAESFQLTTTGLFSDCAELHFQFNFGLIQIAQDCACLLNKIKKKNPNHLNHDLSGIRVWKP